MERHARLIQRTNEAALDPAQGRPSLEAGFHALLGDVVLHLHPVYLNAFACMEDGAELLNQVCPVPCAWVKYCAPGPELAAGVDRAIRGFDVGDKTVCVALENHGFIASGRTAEEVLKVTGAFLSAGRRSFGDLDTDLLRPRSCPEPLNQAAAGLRSLVQKRWKNDQYIVRPARFAAFDVFAREEHLWSRPGPLVPDDVVFAGKSISISDARCVKDVVEEFAEPPARFTLVLKGLGALLLANNEGLAAAMEETLLAHILIRILVARRGRVRPLPPAEVEYLQKMESEMYRIMVTSKESR